MSGLKKKKRGKNKKKKGKVLGFESLGGKWKTCIQVNKKKKNVGKHAPNKFVFKKFEYNSILLKSSSTWPFLIEKAILANSTMSQSTYNSILMILSSTQNSILLKSGVKTWAFC